MLVWSVCLRSCTHLSLALADGLEDGLVLNVVAVVCLNLGGDTGQGAAQSLLGGGVDHLSHDRGIIRGPGNEGQLVPGRLLVVAARMPIE